MSETAVEPATAASADVGDATRFDLLRELLRSPAFIAGTLIVLWWIACAIAGQWFTPFDPYASDPLNSLLPPDHTH